MTKTGAAIIALLLAAAATCAQAAPASLRNGKWEITYRSVETGAKAPAEHAAKTAQPGGKEVTRTFTSCNRRAATEKAMLAVTLEAMHDEGHCTPKALEHTDTSVELEITCAAPNPGKAVFKYDADDGEKVTSSTDEQRADGVTEHIEETARWVGVCSSHS